MGILDHLPTPQSEPDHTEQAHDSASSLAVTPSPTDADASRHHRAYDLGDPDPEHIETVYQHSNELGSVIKRFRRLTWRQRPELEPAIAKRCTHCDRAIEDDTQECPTCESTELRDPSPAEKARFEEFILNAGPHDAPVWHMDVGKRITDDGGVFGAGYAIHKYQYDLDEHGRPVESQLQSVRRGDPELIEPVINTHGNRGGEAWICLACRHDPNYEPREEPGRCPKCQYVLYDAHYVEHTRHGGGKRYWTRWEAHALKWHYPDGSSPVKRLWDKVMTLLWMDKTASNAFNPEWNKSPGKVLVTMGGNKDAIQESAERMQKRNAENPDRLNHLHLEAKTTLEGDKKNLDATVLNVEDEFIKGQSEQLRDKYEQHIRSEYATSAVGQSDVSDAGGLNNEGNQLRAESQSVQAAQQVLESWFDRIADALNVTDWRLRFPNPQEEMDQQEAATGREKLKMAEQAASLGLEVSWREGEVVIEDGDIEAPEEGGMGPEEGPAGPAGPGELDLAQQADEIPDEAVSVDSWDEAPKGAKTLTGERGGKYYIPGTGEDEDGGGEVPDPSDYDGTQEEFAEEELGLAEADYEGFDEEDQVRINTALAELSEQEDGLGKVEAVTTDGFLVDAEGDEAGAYHPKAGSTVGANFRGGAVYLNPESADNPNPPGSRAGDFDSLEHTVVHEVGHARHAEEFSSDSDFMLTSKERLDKDTTKTAIDEVSHLAASDPLEFVAEVHTGLLSGEEYSDEVMDAYEKHNGPGVGD